MTDFEILSIIMQAGLFIVALLEYTKDSHNNKKDYPTGKSK